MKKGRTSPPACPAAMAAIDQIKCLGGTSRPRLVSPTSIRQSRAPKDFIKVGCYLRDCEMLSTRRRAASARIAKQFDLRKIDAASHANLLPWAIRGSRSHGETTPQAITSL